MVTTREQNLKDATDELMKKRFISVDDINNLFNHMEKVLMEFERVTISRENWKKRYREQKEESLKLNKQLLICLKRSGK